MGAKNSGTVATVPESFALWALADLDAQALCERDATRCAWVYLQRLQEGDGAAEGGIAGNGNRQREALTGKCKRHEGNRVHEKGSAERSGPIHLLRADQEHTDGQHATRVRDVELNGRAHQRLPIELDLGHAKRSGPAFAITLRR